ncbi:ExbD/TolR family protein [Archangium gephyra]|uniref:ExbD/TolR family protein n=1 Tax=Archangium gephyra TaxID=48 RepID=UPI003B80AB7E
MAGGSQPRGGIIEGINVTPLVDIVLVLLIIFMVTAKMVVTPAVPVDLPRASQSEEVQTLLAVTIQPDGGLLVDGVVCTDEELREKAREALGRDEGLRAVLHADGAVPHRRVMAVLDGLKASGVERVAFGALPPGADEPAEGGK